VAGLLYLCSPSCFVLIKHTLNAIKLVAHDCAADGEFTALFNKQEQAALQQYPEQPLL